MSVARGVDSLVGVKTMNTNTKPLSLGLALVAGIALAVSGCAASPVCRQGVKDDVAVAGHTAGDAVVTGAKTGVEGVKTAGKAVGGAVTGGASGAASEWNEGKEQTRETARATAGETRATAETPACP